MRNLQIIVPSFLNVGTTVVCHMKVHYNPKLKEYARQLRNNSTPAEIKLWKCLKGKRMFGYDFHRQKPIDEYITDFYCYKLRLVIEIDGYSHTFDDVKKKDKIKERKIKELGFEILRFTENDVRANIDNVLSEIEKYILEFEKYK